MKYALSYSLKVWLTSVVVSPVLVMTGNKMLHPNDDISFGFIGYAITYGLVLTIICWLILFLFTGSLANRDITTFNKRLMISVLAIILTALPFYLLFHNDDSFPDGDLILWVLSYLAVILAGIWVYRLERAAWQAS